MYNLDCHLYSLDSVNTLRKYVKYIDVLFNNTSDFKCTISTTEQNCVTVSSNYFLFTTMCFFFIFVFQKAMQAHDSQYIWFRKLYMKFSRYTRVNTFTTISAD